MRHCATHSAHNRAKRSDTSGSVAEVATIAIVSFRLGLTDGVSVVAARWAKILQQLGHRVVTVAGEGPVDRVVRGLEIQATEPPAAWELAAALADADLVVVQNLCTIPLNLPAARVLASELAGRPALMHHHDPSWQRPHFAHVSELPPNDEAWHHITINRLTEKQLAARGLRATTIYNPFELATTSGDRSATRRLLDVGPAELLIAHPVRAIARKNIPRALEVCEALSASYWLTGPSEEDYEPTLSRLLAHAGCRVLRNPAANPADIYAAADAVVMTSLWEGFGNPPVEAAVHRRPAVVSHYPVAEELRTLGFRWFSPDQLDPLRRHLASPDPTLTDHNRQVVATHLSMEVIGSQIANLLAKLGIGA